MTMSKLSESKSVEPKVNECYAYPNSYFSALLHRLYQLAFVAHFAAFPVGKDLGRSSVSSLLRLRFSALRVR